MQPVNCNQQRMLKSLLASNPQSVSIWQSGSQLHSICLGHPAAVPMPILRRRWHVYALPAPRATMRTATAAGTHSGAQVYAAAEDQTLDLQPGAAIPVDEQHKGLLAEPQQLPSGKATVAVIDIGTSSFHLVVVRASAGDQRRLEVIDQMKEGVRLLSNTGRFNLISSDGVEAGIRVLKRFQQVAATRHASLRAVATSAVREARNGQTFVRQVRERLGMEVEVISGFEEARLIYLGVLQPPGSGAAGHTWRAMPQALPCYDQLALSVDIGGGSTELVLGLDGQPLYTASMRLGHLRLQDRSFPDLAGCGDFTHAQVEDCRSFVRAALADAGVVQEIQENSPPGRSFEVVVGSSGTIEAVAALALGLAGARAAGGAKEEGAGLRDTRFSADQLRAVMTALLQARTREQRLKLPGMQAKRVDVVLPGAVLLDELFTALDVRELRVSPFALREGVLQDSLIRQGHAPTADIRRASILHVASRFDIEQRMTSALHSAQLARQILAGLQAGDCVSPAAASLTANDTFLLEAAVTLHSVGLFVSHAGHHRHAAYIIRNSEHLLGFAPAEVELIALLARYHRKKTPSAKHEEVAKLPGELVDTLRALCAISRIAIALERRNTGGAVQSVAVLQDASSIVFVVFPANSDGVADVSLELWALEQELPYFEKVFGRKCTVVEGCADAEGSMLSSIDNIISK